MYHQFGNTEAGTEEVGRHPSQESSYHLIKFNRIEKRSEESLPDKFWLQQDNIALKEEVTNLKVALADMIERKENAEAEVVNMRGRVRELILSVRSSSSSTNSASVLFNNTDFSTDLSLVRQIITRNDDAVQYLLADCGHLRLEIARLATNQEQGTAEQSERESNLEKSFHILLQEKLERNIENMSLRKDNDKLKSDLAEMTKLKQNDEAKNLNLLGQTYEITEPSPSSSSSFVMIRAKITNQVQATQMQCVPRITVTSNPENLNDNGLASKCGDGSEVVYCEQPTNSKSTQLSPNNQKISFLNTQMAKGGTGNDRPSPKALHGKGLMEGSRISCICGRSLLNEETLQNHIRYHSRERNWDCNQCGRKFAFRSYLKKHLKKTHQKIVATNDQSYMSHHNTQSQHRSR